MMYFDLVGDSAWSLCDVKDFPCVSRTKRNVWTHLNDLKLNNYHYLCRLFLNAGNFTRNGKKANCGQCLPACTEIRYLMEVTETPLLSQAQGWIGERTDIASWSDFFSFHKGLALKNVLSLYLILLSGQQRTPPLFTSTLPRMPPTPA